MMITLCSVKKMPATRIDLLAVRRLERVGDRPEQASIAFCSMHRDADGGDQRQQLVALAAQRREDRRVDQPAEHGADDERDARCSAR